MRRFVAPILFILIFAAHAVAADAPQRDAGAYTFVAIGDNRSGDRVYTKLITALMQRRPDFVVHLGDAVASPGERASWAHFREISRPITVPLYLTPGNHDIEDEKSERVWKEEVPRPGKETYYSFTQGPDLFVVLNSSDPRDDDRIAGQQLAWLRKTLDPAKYRRQFVFVHKPLFLWKGITHEGESLDRYPAERDALHRLFVDRGVDIVFHGHVHLYRRLMKDGVTYIITGGGGQPLYARGTPMSFNHFTIVRVDGDRIEGMAIDRGGTVRDEFVLKVPKRSHSNNQAPNSK